MTPVLKDAMQSPGGALAAGRPIVLFDGVCNLCNGAVQFIVRRDPKAAFRFAALQSEAGAEVLCSLGEPADDLATMVLVENGRAYKRSSAALRIARRLRFPWPILVVFLAVPPFLRDAVYAWIARNRYRWFGKQDACLVPTAELRERFL